MREARDSNEASGGSSSRAAAARAWLRPLLQLGGYVALPLWLVLSLVFCFALLTLGTVGELLATIFGLASLPLGLVMATYGAQWLGERIEDSRGPARRATRRWIARTLDCNEAECERLELLIAELGRFPDPQTRHLELQHEATRLRLERPLAPPKRSDRQLLGASTSAQINAGPSTCGNTLSA